MTHAAEWVDADAGRAGGVAVRELPAGEIERIAPLWEALQDHHTRITPSLGHAPARDSADRGGGAKRSMGWPTDSRRGGATVAWNDECPGVRRFYTEDPWGNRLELVAVRSMN